MGLSLWIGGLTLFVTVVTPISFRSLPREEAGRYIGLLFPAVDRWSLVWSTAAFFSLWGFYGGRYLHPRSLVLELPVGVMTVLTWYLVGVLHPQVREARQKMLQPELQGTVHRQKFQIAFDRFHRLSVRIHAVILFLGWFVLASIPSFLV